MSSRDPRADELNNLRVALATFALHLDAFEARVRGGPLRVYTKSKIIDPPDIDLAIKFVSAMKNVPRAIDSNGAGNLFELAKPT